MQTREIIILRLLEKSGGSTSRLNLMKWAFLLSRNRSIDPKAVYQFFPYKYGPYSLTLMHELGKMAQDGLVLEPDPKSIALAAGATPAALLDEETESHLAKVWSLYGEMTTKQLLDTVYREFPWYTCLSERKRFADKPIAEPMIYTAGYEGLELDGFLNLLLASGIREIIDVRRNPIARKYGFHRRTVENAARNVGIGYSHIPQLGIPSDRRTDLTGFASYERLFTWYEEEVLGSNHELVAQLAVRTQSSPSVLICQERDPLYCHRTRLAKYLAIQNGLERIDLRSLKWTSALKERGYS